MTYEELTAEIIRFANYVPGNSTAKFEAFEYLFSAGDICALYKEYLDAAANDDEELMHKITKLIAYEVRKCCDS